MEDYIEEELRKRKEKFDFAQKNFVKWKHRLLRKHSKAEEHFYNILHSPESKLCYYEREKCFFDKRGHWCYIDFYFPFYGLAIEIDGEEHNTKERKAKDEEKEHFLNRYRHICTYRISNKDCLKMTSIDINEIAERTINEKSYSYDHSMTCFWAFLHKEKSMQLPEMQERASFDVYKKIYLYSKVLDSKFYSGNLYGLKRGTDEKYKNLIHWLENNDDIYASEKFIFDFSKEGLEKKINSYKLEVEQNNKERSKI